MSHVFTTDELAARYGITKLTLTDWRYKGKGPAWFKEGKRVYYREEAVETWEKEKEREQAERRQSA